MEQDNKKKKKIIGISLSVVGALLLLFSGTYAYWQLTKEQSSANEIVAACLDFELSDVTEAISLERAYPISEEESESLTGYTFKVINNCNDSIDYMIGLNSITNNSENYLDNSSLRVKLDDKQSKIYETLNDIEYIENVRYSKELGTSTIQGNSENTHLLKVWVDENAPVTEQGKSFTGKIIITGSVGNTSSGEQIADSCFEIGNDGTILSYDYSCGTDIVVPAEINGIRVKNILTGTFGGVVIAISGGNDCYDDNGTVCNIYENFAFIKNSPKKEEIINTLKEQFCDNPNTCTIDDLENILGKDMDGQNITILTSQEEYNEYDFSQYENIEINSLILEEFVGDSNDVEPSMLATTLDLSEAIYLEKIGERAFEGRYYSAENDGEFCELFMDKGKNYLCSGLLKEVIFPENGMLTKIGEYAFFGNQLTKIVVPSSVTTIEDSAFTNNPLTEVIIKRANADGMTIDSWAFPAGITPTYNPNYTE